MRTAEINKWINEGGSLPQDLTQEEKDHLTKLGWSVEEGGEFYGAYEHHFLHGKEHGKREEWYSNGRRRTEENWFHGMKHGVFKKWWREGNLYTDEEYYYGNRIK